MNEKGPCIKLIWEDTALNIYTAIVLNDTYFD